MGQSFADHARYASLLLQRQTDPAATRRISAAIEELTARAAAAGTVSPAITAADITALIWAMRGLVQAGGDRTPVAWQRFLDIHLAWPAARPDGRPDLGPATADGPASPAS